MVLNDWQRGRIPFFVKPPNAEPPAAPQVRTGWTCLLETMAVDLGVVSFDCLPLQSVLFRWGRYFQLQCLPVQSAMAMTFLGVAFGDQKVDARWKAKFKY